MKKEETIQSLQPPNPHHLHLVAQALVVAVAAAAAAAALRRQHDLSCHSSMLALLHFWHLARLLASLQLLFNDVSGLLMNMS